MAALSLASEFVAADTPRATVPAIAKTDATAIRPTFIPFLRMQGPAIAVPALRTSESDAAMAAVTSAHGCGTAALEGANPRIRVTHQMPQQLTNEPRRDLIETTAQDGRTTSWSSRTSAAHCRAGTSYLAGSSMRPAIRTMVVRGKNRWLSARNRVRRPGTIVIASLSKPRNAAPTMVAGSVVRR